MRGKKLEEMRQDYENIRIPKELRERVEAGIRQAKEESALKQRSRVWVYTGRAVGGVAAAMVAITVMANSGAAMAHAMAKIPVINMIAEVVTFREYESSDNNMEADIKIPEVSVKNGDGTVNEDATQKINQSIQKYTDEIIAQYEADVEADAGGEGYMDVDLDYSVITDNDRLFSIRFDQLMVMAGTNRMVRIYHIDKQTGELLELSGLFKDGVDYVTPISDTIKEQMKERMASDESLVYWVDNEEAPGLNFQSVKEDATFYINENGKLTIVFDKYEVAPGYMGSVEFEIPTEVVQDLIQDGFLK